jgi:hypothetical protein
MKRLYERIARSERERPRCPRGHDSSLGGYACFVLRGFFQGLSLVESRRPVCPLCVIECLNRNFGTAAGDGEAAEVPAPDHIIGKEGSD